MRHVSSDSMLSLRDLARSDDGVRTDFGHSKRITCGGCTRSRREDPGRFERTPQEEQESRAGRSRRSGGSTQTRPDTRDQVTGKEIGGTRSECAKIGSEDETKKDGFHGRVHPAVDPPGP